MSNDALRFGFAALKDELGCVPSWSILEGSPLLHTPSGTGRRTTIGPITG